MLSSLGVFWPPPAPSIPSLAADTPATATLMRTGVAQPGPGQRLHGLRLRGREQACVTQAPGQARYSRSWTDNHAAAGPSTSLLLSQFRLQSASMRLVPFAGSVCARAGVLRHSSSPRLCL